MDFKLVIVVLFAYFIRPQDWVPGMSGINIMKPLMAVTLLAMFTRPRGISLSSLVKTPIDWAIIAYALYIVFSAPSDQRPFVAVLILVAYFFVTSQALSTPRRLTIYLRCWLISLLIVAAMALASEYGLDLTGAKELTHAVPDQPRLVLNTYLFDNANSLGHSVVVAIPLAYFLLMWRKPLALWLTTALLIFLAGYCVYLTQSKGAFIAGFAVVVISLIFGRSKLFQVIFLLLAITIGLEALNKLPRMTDISRARQDEAIMGRMLAWEQARRTSQEKPTGEGFKNFKAIIDYEDEEIHKATHSSYVLVAAELGRYGMFFYLGVLYASFRALFGARCRRPEDETSRRAMLVLLLGYLASSWLIDRSYHLEFFLLAGAVSGFHRRLGIEAGVLETTEDLSLDEDDDDDLDDESSLDPITHTTSRGASDEESVTPSGELATIATLEEVDTSKAAEEAIEEELLRRGFWRRFGIIDLSLVVLLTGIVFAVWDHLLKIYFL